jgi:hypothetical protein
VSENLVNNADTTLSVTNGAICNKTDSDTIYSYEYYALQSLGEIIFFNILRIFYDFFLVFKFENCFISLLEFNHES